MFQSFSFLYGNGLFETRPVPNGPFPYSTILARNREVSDNVNRVLAEDGLVIGNGVEALLRLGILKNLK